MSSFTLDDNFRLSDVGVNITFSTVIPSCATLGLIAFVLLILNLIGNSNSQVL